MNNYEATYTLEYKDEGRPKTVFVSFARPTIVKTRVERVRKRVMRTVVTSQGPMVKRQTITWFEYKTIKRKAKQSYVVISYLTRGTIRRVLVPCEAMAKIQPLRVQCFKIPKNAKRVRSQQLIRKALKKTIKILQAYGVPTNKEVVGPLLGLTPRVVYKYL